MCNIIYIHTHTHIHIRQFHLKYNTASGTRLQRLRRVRGGFRSIDVRVYVCVCVTRTLVQDECKNSLKYRTST